MAQPQTAFVLKYFESFDEFVKVKVVNKEDISRGLFDKLPSNYRDYKSAVVRACVAEYGSPEFEKRLASDDFDRDIIEEQLYQLITDVNSDLNIHTVSILDGRSSLDSKAPAGAVREFTAFERKFRKRIVGQDKVFPPLSRRVKRYITGARDLKRPAGVFLLPGPTGTGKTETAKAVGDILFEGKIIRIDCSEYALPHEYAKLIGAPPGYIGHNEGGCLTNFVTKNPRSVVLFDEIEKANERVFNILYQLFDEGELTDSMGSVVQFGNTFIFLTSNLGCRDVDSFRNRMGFGNSSNPSEVANQLEPIYHEALQKTFGRALLGRVSDIVVYEPMSLEMAIRVAEIEAERESRNLRQAGIDLTYTNGALERVAALADFNNYGGRDIRKVISGQISDPLIDMLASGKIHSGRKIRVDYKDGSFSYNLLKTRPKRN